MSDTYIAGINVAALIKDMESRGYQPEPPESRNCQSLAAAFGIDIDEPACAAFTFHSWGLKQTGSNANLDLGKFMLVIFDLKNSRLLCEQLKEVKRCLGDESGNSEDCSHATSWQSVHVEIKLDAFLQNRDGIIGRILPEPVRSVFDGEAPLKAVATEITVPEHTRNVWQELAGSLREWVDSKLEHLRHG